MSRSPVRWLDGKEVCFPNLNVVLFCDRVTLHNRRPPSSFHSSSSLLLPAIFRMLNSGYSPLSAVGEHAGIFLTHGKIRIWDRMNKMIRCRTLQSICPLTRCVSLKAKRQLPGNLGAGMAELSPGGVRARSSGVIVPDINRSRGLRTQGSFEYAKLVRLRVLPIVEVTYHLARRRTEEQHQ